MKRYFGLGFVLALLAASSIVRGQQSDPEEKTVRQRPQSADAASQTNAGNDAQNDSQRTTGERDAAAAQQERFQSPRIPAADDQPAQQGESARIQQLLATIDRLETRIEELETKLEAVSRTSGALAARVGDLAEPGGANLLGNLNTDSRLRRQVVQATNPPAAVRFYNWDSQPRKISVNGSWYTLKPGTTTVRVPYGPVAVTHCDEQNPQTFSDWTPQGEGFVMVFDVENDGR